MTGDQRSESAAHTPGPWRVERVRDIYRVVYNDCGLWLAEVFADGVDSAAGAEADARLIAAAPDMLAALIKVRRIISDAAMTGFNCHDGDWAERLFASQATTSAAIAKATGIAMTATAGDTAAASREPDSDVA